MCTALTSAPWAADAESEPASMQVKDARSGDVPFVPSAHVLGLRPQRNNDRAS